MRMTIRIDNKFPTPKEFIKNECKTLNYICNNKTFEENCHELSIEAYKKLPQLEHLIDRLKGKKQISNKEIRIPFESYLPILFGGKEGLAYLGFELFLRNLTEYNCITYYLALVCTEENTNPEKSKIIRKYHFDYTTPQNSKRQSHPVFHLQYPGELSPVLQGLNAKYDHLECWLSEPRLYYFPMSLALLLNIILLEFKEDENFYEIREDSDWRDLVRKNEEKLLLPYFKNCYNFLSNRKSDQLFMNDFYYE